MTNKRVSTVETDISMLTDWFRSGIKPAAELGIGTEHEQFLLNTKDYKRLGYRSLPGIRQVMHEMSSRGWNPIEEAGNIIALEKYGASITIEPAGQFELSGRIVSTVHETYRETLEHNRMLDQMGAELGFMRLPMGFDPFWRREDLDWMPKERYRFMRNWMPRKGNLGLDMMTRTTSIQVNLDFVSEEDMVRKMQTAQAFQPVVTALFANSPFKEMKPNGYLSYRSHVWEDTDPDRCGFLPFVFEPDFGFERYVEYLLDVPMYFILRAGKYYPSEGITFREFLKGNHEPEQVMEDWEVHVSTVFPDVRLKRFIEIRGADSGSPKMIAALAALWTGLLYDKQALDSAHSLAMSLGVEVIQGLRKEAPRKGLRASYGEVALHELAASVVRIADGGLARRAERMGIETEQKYLNPLRGILARGTTTAEMLLEKYMRNLDLDLFRLILNT